MSAISVDVYKTKHRKEILIQNKMRTHTPATSDSYTLYSYAGQESTLFLISNLNLQVNYNGQFVSNLFNSVRPIFDYDALLL